MTFQGSANGTKAEDVDDSDDEDDEGSSSDDEEHTAGEVDEAFRAEVQAALGPAVLDIDKEVGTNKTIIV